MADEQTVRLLAEQQQEDEIEALFASPAALNNQNQSVVSTTAAWFTKWNTAVRVRILLISFLCSLLAHISSKHLQTLFHSLLTLF